MSTVIIKKYSNKKLYIPRGMTEPVGYITLEELVNIIKKGKSVKVVDNVTGEDITVSVLKLTLEYVEIDVDRLVNIIRG